MMITPSKKNFIEKARGGRIPPVYAEVPFISPHITYQSVMSANSFLLESIKGSDKIARYSFIGFDPCLTFKVKDGLIEIASSFKQTMLSRKPLSVLKDIMMRYRQLPHRFLPPFQGGIAGMLGYDFVQYFEKLPVSTTDDLNLPDAHFFLLDRVIAFDHVKKRSWVIVCPGVQFSILHDTYMIFPEWSAIYDEAENSIHEMMGKMKSFSMHREKNKGFTSTRHVPSGRPFHITHDMKKHDYIGMVRRAKEYIAAGDIFQANLSQRVSADIMHQNPWNLYEVLRVVNPSPFAAFVDYGDYQIVGSSPERLLRVCNGTIETRPIAGTRPRGKNSAEDEQMRRELLLNEKERAEHIMLIDLERNDIGRVSSYGTVRVDELMITEDYSHVMHIVSNITGSLAEGKDCFDVLRASLPGGTVTGVPKVRCMEIIDELEPLRRGPYTGSIGYIGFSGAMDFNIIIRTFVIKNDSAYVQVGAGIVADSDPEREYDETLNKAEALMKAMKMVQVRET
jgi:anthranilate/para-aminobenzoate synthase component I